MWSNFQASKSQIPARCYTMESPWEVRRSGEKSRWCFKTVQKRSIITKMYFRSFLNPLRNDLNLTCILVSHDLRAVYYLEDEVLRLSEGTVKAIPSSDTIIRPERF